ncbi:hypothetical protein [Spongiactinospora sp. TRM90649]|uniref:hypothetical protein n=1 Tax=Spongiactinospora sp. TRM90649 TaxID=3031114 RepID=UPI0023FA279B|nr:hypothetical protein [Spongiactinospora sp. TRM90649]MDF5758545.1 hypothetical protein [Spongiactinospora sp. TRM90649]
MRRTPAAMGSATFFAIGPGVVADLLPWLMTHWRFADPLPAGCARNRCRAAGSARPTTNTARPYRAGGRTSVPGR